MLGTMVITVSDPLQLGFGVLGPKAKPITAALYVSTSAVTLLLIL